MTLLIAAMALAAAACGTTTTPTVAPATSAPAGQPAQITITAATGLTYTFFVTSCESPGPNIVNLQGEGNAGDFRLAASLEGVFRITGSTVVEATVDEVEVAEDGSVTASGTLSDPDAPDLSVPFELQADPGSCS